MKNLSGVFIMVLSVFFCALGARGVEGDLENGKILYKKYCEVCHGSDGKGDGYLYFDPPVADLTSPTIQKKSDGDLWRSVHEGVQNTAMGTWRFILSDDEITTVLAYVRFLGQ